MIGFRIGTDILELEPGTRIGLNLVNPLFSREIGYGSHSFQFTAPLTAVNRKMLGFMDSLFVSDYNNEKDVDVLMGNNFWKQGTLKVIQVAPVAEKVSLAFNLDTSWLADKISTLRLADLDLGGTRTQAGAGTVQGTFEVRVSSSINDDISIKINDTTYTHTSTVVEDPQTLVSQVAFLINTDTSINATATTQINGSYWQLVITADDPDEPFQVFYQSPFVTTDITWYQMSYLSSYQNDQNAMLSHMDTVSAAAVGVYDYCFAPIYNPDYFADAVGTEYSYYINAYEAGAGHVEPSIATGEQYYTACTPFASVSYLIQQAVSSLGLTDISTFTSSDKITGLHLYNSVPVLQEGVFEGTGSSETGYVGYFDNSFDLIDHMPVDMTVAELFADLGDMFNIAIIVDPVVGTIDFVERKDALSSAQRDWTEKSLADYQITYKDTVSVSYSYQADDKDKLFEQGRVLNTVDPGNAKHKISVARPPLFDQKRTNTVDSEKWKTVEIRQQGYTSAAGLTPSDYRARYFYYHGMQDNANSNTYPASSNDGRAYDDTQLITPALTWDGAQGLYAQQHESFEPLLYPDRNVSHSFLVDMLDLLSLSWTDSYLFRTKKGRGQGIIKSLSLEIPASQRPPIIAKAEVFLT